MRRSIREALPLGETGRLWRAAQSFLRVCERACGRRGDVLAHVALSQAAAQLERMHADHVAGLRFALDGETWERADVPADAQTLAAALSAAALRSSPVGSSPGGSSRARRGARGPRRGRARGGAAASTRPDAAAGDVVRDLAAALDELERSVP